MSSALSGLPNPANLASPSFGPWLVILVRIRPPKRPATTTPLINLKHSSAQLEVPRIMLLGHDRGSKTALRWQGPRIAASGSGEVSWRPLARIKMASLRGTHTLLLLCIALASKGLCADPIAANMGASNNAAQVKMAPFLCPRGLKGGRHDESQDP
ncbi:hypothetical protein ACHAPX_001798 [Trichoderma viride]